MVFFCRKFEPQNLSRKLATAELQPKSSTVRTAETSKLKKEHRKRKLSSRPERPVKEDEDGDLLTNKHYYVSYYEPISDEIETESRPDIIKGAQSQLEGKFQTRYVQKYHFGTKFFSF